MSTAHAQGCQWQAAAIWAQRALAGGHLEGHGEAKLWHLYGENPLGMGVKKGLIPPSAHHIEKITLNYQITCLTLLSTSIMMMIQVFSQTDVSISVVPKLVQPQAHKSSD